MSAKLHFREHINNQLVLFPERIDKDIASDDPVRLVNAVVDSLDMGRIYSLYYDRGASPYHPRMMLKAIIYGYMNNIYSCRKIETALKRDVHFIWLAGYDQPDHKTINNFRNRVKDEIANKPIPQDALKVIEDASRNMPWYDRWTGGRKDQVQYTGPAGIVNNMYRHQGEYSKGMAGIEAMENANAPLRKVDTAWLKRAIEGLEAIVKSETRGRALVFVDGSNQGEYKELSPKQAQDLLAQYQSELNYRGTGGSTSNNATPPGGSYSPSGDKTTTTGGGSGHSKAEDKFKAEKEWREREEALNRIAYATGQKNYED